MSVGVGIDPSIPRPRVWFPLGVAPMLAIGVGVGCGSPRYDCVGLNVLAIGVGAGVARHDTIVLD